MRKEEILKKAIEKAINNGYKHCFNGTFSGSVDEIWRNYIGEYSADYYSLIFNHDFAKAFWGEDEEIYGYETLPSWAFNLETMVLLENPLKYLEKFI